MNEKDKQTEQYLFNNMGKNLKSFKTIINNPIDVNSSDSDGRTLLMIAIANNCEEVIDILIRKKAAIDARDADGWTPLIYAVQFNRCKIVKLLLKKGADITLRDYHWNYDAYHWAKHNKNSKIASLLSKIGSQC